MSSSATNQFGPGEHPVVVSVTLDGNPGEQPVTVCATVPNLQRREETSFLGRVVGLEAQLDVLFPGDNRPHTYYLSRLVGEPCWVQDAHFGPNNFPYFSNGFGARYLKLTGVAPGLERLLDQAARGRGLVDEDRPRGAPSAAESSGVRGHQRRLSRPARWGVRTLPRRRPGSSQKAA
ncbi:hypothetical protein REH65_31235 [Saccharopolyspora sp. ID03-671]|uniref:hypothetical protein n=1 Tax=Saccharopolyspora sp. ID03-671 TaxID=3073066 RepID=UPI0032503503